MLMKYGKSDGRNRKPLSNFGINDSPYVTQRASDKWFCPHYRAWSGMIYRGTSAELHNGRRPTYKNCSVSEDWKYFTNFLRWSIVNYVEGWALDKDVLEVGNKIYGPERCSYLPDYINNLFIRDTKPRKLPMGVGMTQSKTSPFTVSVSAGNNLTRNVGKFKTAEEAHSAWQQAKSELTYEALKRYAKEPDGFRTDVADSINCRVWKLLLDKSENRETKTL